MSKWIREREWVKEKWKWRHNDGARKRNRFEGGVISKSRRCCRIQVNFRIFVGMHMHYCCLIWTLENSQERQRFISKPIEIIMFQKSIWSHFDNILEIRFNQCTAVSKENIQNFRAVDKKDHRAFGFELSSPYEKWDNLWLYWLARKKCVLESWQ